MDMGDMMDRCMDMIGGGMMGNGLALVVLLLALFLAWVIGLGVLGTLIFWGVRRLSRPHT